MKNYETLAKYINPKITPKITNKFRPDDIRHCFTDISKISSKLGYTPKYSFEEGIKELINWVKFQKDKATDKSSIANEELRKKDLIK